MDAGVVGVFIPIVGSICVFTFLTLIIVLPALAKSKERQKLQDTIRHAIDKGQELPAEAIAALSADAKRTPPSAHRDLRYGAVWLAVGIGIAIFGLVLGIDDQEFPHPILGLAAIPAFVGVALIIVSFFNPNKGDQA